MTQQQAIEQAVRNLLIAIGEDPNREGLGDTPARVARSWSELTSGIGEDPADHLETHFNVGADGLVLIRDIAFHTLCEHHLLPFHGVAHVAYVPRDGVVTGLSKVARCVEGYSRRLQVQERLTQEIAEALVERLDPQGVAVMVEAEHLCMGMRGVRKPGAKTITTCYRGDIDRREFLELVRQ